MFNKPDFFNHHDEIYCRDLAITLWVTNELLDIYFVLDENNQPAVKIIIPEQTVDSRYSSKTDDYELIIPWHVVPFIACLDEVCGPEAVFLWAARELKIPGEYWNSSLLELQSALDEFEFDFNIRLIKNNNANHSIFQHIVDEYMVELEVIDNGNFEGEEV